MTKHLLIILLLLCSPVCLTGYSYTTYAEGLATIHVLTINSREHTIIAVRAQGEPVSRETVFTLANRYGDTNGKDNGMIVCSGTGRGTGTKKPILQVAWV